jgi:eukaryotic-like serine/threonine-protein kinase
MTPERWRQIEHLYNLACDRGEEVLANADPELRRKVQEMLAQKSGGGMLDQAAIDLMTDSSRTRIAAGSTLGPYRIEGLLGRGGMGEVYRAHDPRLRRDVAIKISAAEISERFEREARAVAALNHPNICQIYDVGPNYLVMELMRSSHPSLRYGEIASEIVSARPRRPPR